MKKKNPKDYTNHSGGAIGADSMWDTIGREFGVTDHRHYWYYKPNPKSLPKHEITEREYKEGEYMVAQANKTLRRRNTEKYMYLLARNWAQVKHSGAIYAIGSIYHNRVNGGTGWACQMAIDIEKPLYVYEQYKKQWYFWNENSFEVCVTPVLVKDFAGIGTREINDDGIQAIRNVYIKTFGKV